MKILLLCACLLVGVGPALAADGLVRMKSAHPSSAAHEVARL